MAEKVPRVPTNEDTVASMSKAADHPKALVRPRRSALTDLEFPTTDGDEDSYMADELASDHREIRDLKFPSEANIDFGHHKMREALNLNVTEPFDQRLVEQIGGDEGSSSWRLFLQLYGYATQGKIDSFKDTIERKLEADKAHDPNARVWLLSGLSPHKNTLLHIAASFGHAKLAAEILDLHKPLLFEKNFDK